MNRDAIPVSFTDQEFSSAIQEQAEVPRYAGIRFFLASDPTTTSSGNLRFSFRVLNTVIRIKACGLPAGTYTKLSLTTEEPLFVQEGSFGLEDLKITGKTCSNSLEVALKGFTLSEASTLENPALVYLTSAPIDLSGKAVTVRIFSDDNSIYLCEKTPTYAYEAHHLGSLKCEMVKESAIIYYTSSDNNIVDPIDAFGGATIVSNVHNGSKGILTFDADVTQIGTDAFKNCSTLTGITIPETVTSIGNYAFQNCTSLTSITIPDKVSSIGEGAFMGCTNLSSIDMPDRVSSLGVSVFSGCEGLTSIIIPYGVTSIDNNAFAECTKLVSVTIPETVISIGESAFQSCFKLNDISIPNGVTSIGQSAFASCTSLTSIVIPSQVTGIKSFAFWSCDNLASVTLPDGLMSIEENAFSSCPSLNNIIIPSNVTTIGENAFSHSGLTSIVIPESVTSIGNWAFNECSGLTHITVHANNPPSDVTGATFADTNNSLIYVPSGSVDAYKTTTGWCDYASRICDHVYVEMGNGMKWATTNVGAVGPDDLGDYFAWGRTLPLTTPDMNYNPSSPFIDTANAIWGGNWRMPTRKEWQDLMDEDYYTWTWDPVRKGTTVESKVPGYEGNKIFLPAAGIAGVEGVDGIFYVGGEGDYWARSPRSEGFGWTLVINPGGVFLGDYGFGAGLSIRPLFESNPVGNIENPNDSGNEEVI